MNAQPGSPGALSSAPAIAGLILAAGGSRRMGRDKALLTYRGRTFLENILATLRAGGIERVTVVLGHHAEEIRKVVDLRAAEVVVNRDYHLGQTSSLQTGLRALGSKEPDAVLLCLVDHPAFATATIRRLLSAYQACGKPVVIPECGGRHGHPVLLGREVFPELRGVSPDTTANSVIHKYRLQTEFVEVADPGILLDIDDREDYRRLNAQE